MPVMTLSDGTVIRDDKQLGYGSVSPMMVAPVTFDTRQDAIPQQFAEEVAQTDQPRPVGATSKTYLAAAPDPSTWTWEQIRDYVVAGIVDKIGNFPRNPLRESGIFKSFLSRWGANAGPIAVYAIDSCEGWWQDAPISVNRFCKGSDPYFASVIADRLGLTPASA